MEDDVAGIHTEAHARRLLTAIYDSVPDDDPHGAALLRGMRRRQARRRIRTRAGIAAGSAVLAGAGAVAGFLVASVPAAHPAPPASSALAAVTAALVKTNTQNYHTTATFTTNFAPHGRISTIPLTRATGEFNPARQEWKTAYYWWNHTSAETRYVGGYLYEKQNGPVKYTGKPWDRYPNIGGQEFQGVPGYVDLLSPEASPGAADAVTPQDLTGMLKSATTMRPDGPASGPGWTGTSYSFTLPSKTERYGGGSPFGFTVTIAITGTISVDSHGLVRQLDTTTNWVGQLTETQDVTFEDFGAPVTVTAPPASQVQVIPGGR